jgi:hypothetical protein
MLKAEARQSDKKGAGKGKVNARSATPQAEGPNLLWHQLATRVQAKLSVSAPGDPFEREADQVADQVMRMPTPTVQRACAACTAGGARCPKCADEEREKAARPLIQRKAQGVCETETSVSDEFLTDLGPGQRLDRATQDFMESRFNHSFEDVRIHTGAKAAASARAIQARAYTTGSHVVFGEAEYTPYSSRGQRVLAHELTHTIQQSGGADPSVQRAEGPILVERTVEVTTSDAETTLTLPSLLNVHRVHLFVEEPSLRGHQAFAWEYLRAEEGRSCRILRIVAAPGVRIVPEGWPAQYICGMEHPGIEVFRVQDPALVPPQGQLIVPSRYVGTVDPFPASRMPLAKMPDFVVRSTPTRVEIAFTPGNITVVIDVRNLVATDRFAYEINPGDALGRGAEVRIVKTPTTPILVRAPAGAFLFPIRIFEVDNVADVPPQGRPIHPVGRELSSVRGEAIFTTETQIARFAFPIIISLIPIVGEIYMIADFVYGLSTDHDLMGNPLDLDGKVMLGFGALVGLVGLGVRGLPLIVRAIRRGPEAAESLSAAIRELSAEDQATIKRVEDLVRRGQKVSPADEEAVARLLQRVNARAMGATGGTERAAESLLNAEQNGFTDPELQATYQRYLANASETRLAPSQWLRQTEEGRAAAARALGQPEAAAAHVAAETVAVRDVTQAAAQGAETQARVVRSFRTLDGLHEIKLLEDGSLVRCSVCGHLRYFYQDVLEAAETPADRELASRFREIESRARSRNPAIAEDAARQAAALEPTLRTRGAAMLGQQINLPPELVEPFLRLYPIERVRAMEELLRFYSTRPSAVQSAFARAMEMADSVGRAEIVHLLELNLRGNLPSAGLEQSLTEMVAFMERYSGRLMGDLASRYFRLVTNEPAQARAELALAEDILEGRTPLGRGRTVEGLTSEAQGVRLPEYRVGGGEGATTPQFAEVKQITGRAENAFDRNLRSAIDQIHGGAAQAGAQHAEGFIRLDLQEAGRMQSGTFRDAIQRRLRVSDPTGLVRWVEVQYLDLNGQPRRLLFRAEFDRRGVLQLRYSGAR